METRYLPAFCGVFLAIVITTAMDATGYSMFSALPLVALGGLFWWLQGFDRKQVGLAWTEPRGYVAALAYPLAVLGIASAIAVATGATNTADADWGKTTVNVALGSTIGILGVLLTEEFFFRGWLWAALTRAGLTSLHVLWISSLAFTVWHLSAISLDTGFDLPAREIPVLPGQCDSAGPRMGHAPHDDRLRDRGRRVPCGLERNHLSAVRIR